MTRGSALTWCLLGFLGGIACGSFLLSSLAIAAALGGTAFILAALAVFQTRFLFCCLLVSASFSAGTLLACWQAGYWRVLPAPQGVFSGDVRVIGMPAEKDFFQEVRLRATRCDDDRCGREAILWQAPSRERLTAGERLAFSCQLTLPKNASADFDYRMFLAKEGIGTLCEQGKGSASPLPPDGVSRLSSAFFLPRQKYEIALTRSLSEPEAGFAKGLLLGGSGYLPESLAAAFSRIGLTHIVAVSGYNIALVAEFFLALGITAGLFRKQAVGIAAIFIVLFVAMVGAPASAVRAGVMAGIGFLALESGRLGKRLNIVLLAAASMLLANPLLLRYDTGFQLSFLATLGILFGQGWFKGLFEQEFPGRSLVEILWLTGFIELFVAPIILLEFHTFSWFSLIANLVLLPLVPFAMGLSFLAATAFLLLPGAHYLLAWAAYVPLTFMTRFAETAGGWRLVSLTTGPLPAAILLWYPLCIGTLLFLEGRREKKWHAHAFSLPPDR